MTGVAGRSGKAGWLFADVAIALAFIFLATAAGASPDEPPPAEAASPAAAPTPAPDDAPCAATARRFPESLEGRTEPLFGFGATSDPVAATEALRAWLAANGIADVEPAFVQVFGLSTSGDTGYELSLAERYRDQVLPAIVPPDVIVDTYQGTTRNQDGVDVLWYIAQC